MIAFIKKEAKTTCGQMNLLLWVCLIMSVMFGAVAFTSWYREHHAVKTVVVDTVPSIIAAERSRATLADANANFINAALISEADGGTYSKTFRKEMDTVHTDMVTATENITYGDEERKPIIAIMQNLGTYERVVGDTLGRSISSSMPSYVEANRIMREKILKAGEALSDANYGHMSTVYNAHVEHVMYEQIAFIAAGFLMLAALLFTQLVLYRKTLPMFNVGFMIATVTTVLLIGYVSITMIQSESRLKLAKQDAFDSVNALWKAKAIAYDANNDESLYLLYHGVHSQQDYVDQTFKFKAKQFDKLLKDEAANITFPGEKAAATATINAWKQYVAIDTNIRKLETSGQYAQALKLNVGTQQGESNWAFDKFDAALTKTLAINNDAMESAGSAAMTQLKYVPYVIGIAWLIIFISCIFGMKPRLEEYK
jgi:hypothetical protein